MVLYSEIISFTENDEMKGMGVAAWNIAERHERKEESLRREEILPHES
jgi:hypothetical protein